MAGKRLTAISVQAIRPQDHRVEIPDKGARGLYLVVQPSGRKSFAVRYRFDGKPKKLTLDAGISLAGARAAAARALLDVERGIDPTKAKAAARIASELADATTLRSVAEAYLEREEGRPAGRRLRSIGQRRATFERLIFPVLGGRPIGDIRRGEVVKLLDKVEAERGGRMADEVLVMLRIVFDWHALRDEDFRSPLVRGMTRTRPQDRMRGRVLSDDELRKVWHAAGAMPGPFGLLVQFLLLTAARRNEAARMTWSEVADGVWVVPASRYKSKHDHLVPLSQRAQELLAQAPAIAGAGYVFTNADGMRAFNNFAEGKRALDKLASVTGWRLHDLRRVARSLLARGGIAPEIAERCLGHSVGGALGRTYDRHRYESELRHAFEALAAQIELVVNAPADNVVPLRQR
jgi:integrase